jgi:transmembrane sensor
VNVPSSDDEALDIAARDAREHATEWLIRRHDHDGWNERDQVELDAWLAKSPSHMVAYLRVEAAWRRVDRLRALRRPSDDKSRMSPLFKIAAALSIVVALGFLIMGNRPVPQREYVTRIGGHEIVKLDDGSQIELNTNTVLRTRTTVRARTVWLDKGEAYFQVRHDVTRPFVVFAAGHRMTDLGTKFLVRSGAKHVEVALIEGQIRFESVGTDVQGHSALMTPGDFVVATTDSMSVTKVPNQQLANQLGWRNGLLVFKHTTLENAVNEFNRYNQEKLLIADPAVARLTVYGTFRTSNLREFIEVAQAVFGLRAEVRGNTTVISR